MRSAITLGLGILIAAATPGLRAQVNPSTPNSVKSALGTAGKPAQQAAKPAVPAAPTASGEQTRAASGGQACRPGRDQTRTTSCQTDWETRSQACEKAWNKEGNEAGGETDCTSSGEARYSRQRTGGRGKRSETGSS
jgi:hypothetical protein